MPNMPPGFNSGLNIPFSTSQSFPGSLGMAPPPYPGHKSQTKSTLVKPSTEKSIFDLSPEKPSRSSFSDSSMTSLPGPPILPCPPRYPDMVPPLPPSKQDPPPPAYSKPSHNVFPQMMEQELTRNQEMNRTLGLDQDLIDVSRGFGVIKPSHSFNISGLSSGDQAIDSILGFNDMKHESELTKSLFDPEVSDFTDLFPDTSTLSLLDPRYNTSSQRKPELPFPSSNLVSKTSSPMKKKEKEEQTEETKIKSEDSRSKHLRMFASPSPEKKVRVYLFFI